MPFWEGKEISSARKKYYKLIIIEKCSKVRTQETMLEPLVGYNTLNIGWKREKMLQYSCYLVNSLIKTSLWEPPYAFVQSSLEKKSVSWALPNRPEPNTRCSGNLPVLSQKISRVPFRNFGVWTQTFNLELQTIE